ncbi:MAG: response regulator transcription factor [Chloroflexi bacterium]|nr:response regulator transcription factor [Chloroflexota bacterium]
MTSQTSRKATAAYPARVVIIDSQELARYGLRGMLAGQPEFEVVTEAEDGRQGVALCRHVRPDLVLTDVRLVGLDGIAVISQIKADSSRTSIIVVTAEDAPTYLRAALSAGASAFLLKSTTRADLLAAMRRTLDGETVIDQGIATRLLRTMVAAPAAHGITASPRELEVLRLLTLGQTNQQIGLELGVSQRTAKAYVERIIERLGVANRTEAVARAIAAGLIEPPAANHR